MSGNRVFQESRPPHNPDQGNPFRSLLPPSAYTGQAFFERECGSLFVKEWVFVGFAHELKTTGDAIPVMVANTPILLVRNKAGEINAFHNVCRHRCVKLVDEPGNLGRVIRCPYHAWVYGLDGKLRSAPHFGGPNLQFPDGFERDDFALCPVRSAVWQDWIFVNLSGDAPDFEAYAKPIKEQLSGLDLAKITPIGSIDFGEVACNWKFLMENFIEPYHVQYLHTTTTNQPLLDHSTIEDGPCLGSAVDISETGTKAVSGQTLDVSSRYLTLFPNFVLGWYFPDQMGVYLNLPVTAGVTRQRRVLYHKQVECLDGGSIDRLKELWFKVHKEDHWICEKMQKGWASRAAAGVGGVLSPHWETSVRRFQEFVLASCPDDQSRSQQ